MHPQQVDMYLVANADKFPSYYVPYIRQSMLEAPEFMWPSIAGMQLSNPTLALLLSIFVGYLGIDRFYIGDVGLGILKLITGGGCGVWAVIDWFLIMGAARKRNLGKINNILKCCR